MKERSVRSARLETFHDIFDTMRVLHFPCCRKYSEPDDHQQHQQTSVHIINAFEIRPRRPPIIRPSIPRLPTGPIRIWPGRPPRVHMTPILPFPCHSVIMRTHKPLTRHVSVPPPVTVTVTVTRLAVSMTQTRTFTNHHRLPSHPISPST